VEDQIVAQRLNSSVAFILFCAVIFPVTGICLAAQPPAPQTQKAAASAKTTPAPAADVSGDWQVSWEVRLGTDKGTLHLQQDGKKLTGTFKDLHGLSPLSGMIDENRLSFEVQFQGKYPFTTKFTGTANSGKIEGTSQAINVSDGGGAFLGHGGEVVHPEHPWTATRAPQSSSDQAGSGQSGANLAGAKPISDQSSSAKN
jgi:hypothetical protein